LASDDGDDGGGKNDEWNKCAVFMIWIVMMMRAMVKVV
jgi:hypothetical protein